MKFAELVELAIECIKTYNPVYKTIDSHADEFLASVSLFQFQKLKFLIKHALLNI